MTCAVATAFELKWQQAELFDFDTIVIPSRTNVRRHTCAPSFSL